MIRPSSFAIVILMQKIEILNIGRGYRCSKFNKV